MELVDDDHVERVGRNGPHPVGMQRLHRREHVPPPLGPRTTHVQFAELRVAEHLPIGAQRLLQDFPAVRHEQQRRPLRRTGPDEPAEIQGGHHGLAGAGGGDHQVAVPPVGLPLDRQRFEHDLLVRVGPDLQPGQHDHPRARARPGRRGERVVQPVRVPGRLVRLETRFVPVGVEGGLELGQQLRGGHAGQPDIPFDAVQQRATGQVGRADVGGVEVGAPAEQPGLGVQPGAQSVELDPDLGAELGDQPV